MRYYAQAFSALLAVATLGPAPAPAGAESLPPGVQAAQLLPGWVDAQGRRVSALELVLAPGWKTYWRSPGDTGVPPMFDWSGSGNLGSVELHWPAPEVITSGGQRSFGYHDRLVLPLTAVPQKAGTAVDLVAHVDFGLCKDVCVPAHLTLRAPPAAAGGPEAQPAIAAALTRLPRQAADQPACRITEISDGMQVNIRLPGPAEAVAIELAGAPEIWVSTAAIMGDAARADLVAPSAKPFALDPAQVVVTLVAPGGAATEAHGCRPEG